jgi:hypothetical protein
LLVSLFAVCFRLAIATKKWTEEAGLIIIVVVVVVDDGEEDEEEEVWEDVVEDIVTNRTTIDQGTTIAEEVVGGVDPRIGSEDCKQRKIHRQQ